MINKLIYYLFRNSARKLFLLSFIFITLPMFAQTPIMGIILDDQGNPVIGATVSIKGTTTGVITDVNGRFNITAKNSDILQFSYVGMATLERSASESANITLSANAIEVGDVVVTALGIKREEKALHYNVQQIDASDVNLIKDANFVNALQGKVAGVTINSSSSGIGGAARVVMRGTKSLSKDNNTLYVIDGIPMFNSKGAEEGGPFASQRSSEGIADLNPEDIASMSILTGAAAAALYGSNAANGAILITTKKGTDGKIKVSFTNNTDFSSPFVLPNFQNRYGNKPGEFASWGNLLNPEQQLGYNPRGFFNTGINTTSTISLSAGNQKNQTYASFGATNANGTIQNNKYSKINFTIRNTTKFLHDKMTLDIGANYINQKDQNMMSQGQYFNPLVPVYLFPRGEDFNAIRLYERFDEGRNINTQYWPYGNQGMAMQNPYWITNRNVYGNKKNRFAFNASLSYEILDWLSVSGRAKIDNATTSFEKKYHASTDLLFAGEKGFYGQSKTIDNQIYADAMININKDFKDFNVNANIGGSISDTRSDGSGWQGPLKDIPNFFALNNIDRNGRDAMPLQSGYAEQTQSVFASAEISWRRMIYLSATVRNDWASALANSPKNSFIYPSVGLSLVISEMTDRMPDFISLLKVRGSFSQVGSAPSRGLTSPTFSFNSSTGDWATVTHMPIDQLYPEKTNSWETGVNIKLWGGRLNADFTYYRTNTFNQTFNPAISASSGYSSMYVQSGNVQNQGFEVSLGGDNSFGDFTWSTNATFSFNENKVIELVNNYTDPVTGESLSIKELSVGGMGTAKYILKEGGSMGDLYTTSDIKRDANGEIFVDPATGKISLESIDPRYMGSTLPKFNIGFKNDFYYKNLSFGFLITARVGGIVVSPTQGFMDKYGVSENSALARDKGGIPINNGSISAQDWYEVTGGDAMLSNYTYSATNIRLQEVYIAYTFPKKWFRDKLALTLAVVGKNLWMIYNKAPFDPENTAFTGTYNQGIDYFMQPGSRNLGFNIKLTL